MQNKNVAKCFILQVTMVYLQHERDAKIFLQGMCQHLPNYVIGTRCLPAAKQTYIKPVRGFFDSHKAVSTQLSRPLFKQNILIHFC